MTTSSKSTETVPISVDLLKEIRGALIVAAFSEDGLDAADAMLTIAEVNRRLGIDVNTLTDLNCPNCDGMGGAMSGRRCSVCWNWRGDGVWEYYANLDKNKPEDK